MALPMEEEEEAVTSSSESADEDDDAADVGDVGEFDERSKVTGEREKRGMESASSAYSESSSPSTGASAASSTASPPSSSLSPPSSSSSSPSPLSESSSPDKSMKKKKKKRKDKKEKKEKKEKKKKKKKSKKEHRSRHHHHHHRHRSGDSSGDDDDDEDDDADDEDFDGEDDENDGENEAENDDENEEDDDDGDEDDDDDESRRRNKRKSSKRGRFDDRGTSGGSKKRRKKRRSGVAAFLDMEAEVGDEDEESDGDDLYSFADEAAEAERLAEDSIHHRRRLMRLQEEEEKFRLGRRGGGAGHLESAIDSLARRYQDQTFEEGEEDDLIDEQEDIGVFEEPGDSTALLPDISDPKLWMVKIGMNGIERELCINIQNKYWKKKAEGEDLGIFSVYAADNVRGYIYVEADSQYRVKQALHGFRHCQLWGDLKMVPIKEMPSVFAMGNRKKSIPRRGEFVRVKRGIYAGDLAQIHEVDEQGHFVTLRLIPRLDLNDLLERDHRGDKASGVFNVRKGKGRPMKRLFDRDEVDSKGGQIEQGSQPGTVRFAGLLFEETGFILRRANIDHLLVGEAVIQDLAEMKEFKSAMREDADAEAIQLSRSLAARKAHQLYRVNEEVEVVKGDLTGVKGRITKVGNGDELEVQPDDPNLKTFSLPKSQLMKRFSVGSNVRATAGINEGDTGMITAIDRFKAIAKVFSPSSGQEFSCRIDYLTTAPDSGLGGGGLSSVNGFNLGDLVQLTNGEVGLLCYIDRNKTNATLLTSTNETKIILANLLGALVTITAGPLTGTTGRVHKIWKSSCFLKTEKRQENGGFIAVASHSVKLKGGDVIYSKSLDSSAWSASLGAAVGLAAKGGHLSTSPDATQLARGRGFRGRGGRGRGGGRRPRDVGRIVKIVSGKYKGMFASVREVESDLFKCLLQARPEEIKVKRSAVEILETVGEYGERISGTIGSFSSSSFGSLGQRQGDSGSLGLGVSTPGGVSMMNRQDSLGLLLPHQHHQFGSNSGIMNSAFQSSSTPSAESFNIDFTQPSTNRLSTPHWLQRGVEVRIVSLGEYYQKQGIVGGKGKREGEIAAHVHVEDDYIAISVESLVPLPPLSPNSEVIVCDGGVHNGKRGKFLGSAGNDSLILLEDGSKIQLLSSSVFSYKEPPLDEDDDDEDDDNEDISESQSQSTGMSQQLSQMSSAPHHQQPHLHQGQQGLLHDEVAF